jgi:hypothetical protein
MAATVKVAARVRRIEQTGRFRALDEHGEWHTLHVFASLVAAGPGAGVERVQSIRTEDGEVVGRVARGEYRTEWGEASARTTRRPLT